MIQCNKCNVQYIGETKRHLSDRFGEQRHAIEKHNNTLINQPPLQITLPYIPVLSMDNIELVPLEPTT